MSRRRNRKRLNNPVAWTGSNVTTLAVVAVAGVALFLAWRWLKARPGVFNPASTSNVVYTGASSLVEAVTGDPNATVGTKIADWFKPAAEKKVDAMLKTVPKAAPRSKAITIDPFGNPVAAAPAPSNAGADALDTISPYMQGVDDIEDVIREHYLDGAENVIRLRGKR